MAFEKALELLHKKFKPPYRDCVIIRVKINVENIGLFDSIVENSGRCCLPSTEKANHGEINLFVTPHLKEETLKLLNFLKSVFPELEIYVEER